MIVFIRIAAHLLFAFRTRKTCMLTFLTTYRDKLTRQQIRLQGQGLPQTHSPQGHPIQEGQGFSLRAGKASLRPQTIRLWWSDQARLPQEGKDNEEGCVKIGVHSVQVQDAITSEALQALRAWWRQKDKGCCTAVRE